MNEKLKVTTLEQLLSLANAKASVCDKDGGSILPAGFVLNMPGEAILRRMKHGLYAHIPGSADATRRDEIASIFDDEIPF